MIRHDGCYTFIVERQKGNVIMTYEECLDAIVTKEEARREILAHHASFEEFLVEAGDRDEYEAMTVLTWLGY
jgi:hypothetical protein